MKASRGFHLKGIPRNGYTKVREFLSVIERNEDFAMKHVADRLRGKGHVVVSTSALANYARQDLEHQYIERVEIVDNVTIWRRIA